MVDAERKRRVRMPGAEVLEIDGLVLAFSNVADPSLNSVVVERQPSDALAALRAAEDAFRIRGHELGVDLQIGRHPSVDRAVRSLGLSRIIEQPGMAMDPAGLRPAATPDDIAVREVADQADAHALVRVGELAFGDDPEVAGRFYAAGSSGVPGTAAFVGWESGEPVAIATSYLHEGAVGIFGVAVVPAARGRGIGTAITTHAAHAYVGADLAWLHPTEMATKLYERIGFRRVSDWEVWVRRA